MSFDFYPSLHKSKLTNLVVDIFIFTFFKYIMFNEARDKATQSGWFVSPSNCKCARTLQLKFARYSWWKLVHFQ